MSDKWLMGGEPSGVVSAGDVLAQSQGTGRLGLSLASFSSL